ncbi:MAG: hypothetical protein WC959_05455 [Kiritimatiellales bacterium]
MEKLKIAKTLDAWVEIFRANYKKFNVAIHEGVIDDKAIQQMIVQAPAIFVTALSAQPSKDIGDDTMAYETVFSAFIITKGTCKMTQGLNVSETMLVLLRANLPEIAGVQRAVQPSWQNIVSAGLSGLKVSLNAVAWRHQILLGEPNEENIMYTDGVAWPDGAIPEKFCPALEDETQP